MNKDLFLTMYNQSFDNVQPLGLKRFWFRTEVYIPAIRIHLSDAVTAQWVMFSVIKCLVASHWLDTVI